MAVEGPINDRLVGDATPHYIVVIDLATESNLVAL